MTKTQKSDMTSHELKGVMTKNSHSAMTPNSVIKELIEGNKRYRTGAIKARDLAACRAKTIKQQFPKAIVLSCIDSRVPVEIIFDQGIGDLFVARVAGNFENNDILASMEFACQISGSRLVLVLGHQGCGAIQAACRKVKIGNITRMLSKLEPAIIETERQLQNSLDRTSHEFIQIAVENNVWLTIDRIRRDSPVLSKLEKSNAIKIIGGIYYLDSGEVKILETD